MATMAAVAGFLFVVNIAVFAHGRAMVSEKGSTAEVQTAFYQHPLPFPHPFPSFRGAFGGFKGGIGTGFGGIGAEFNGRLGSGEFVGTGGGGGSSGPGSVGNNDDGDDYGDVQIGFQP